MNITIISGTNREGSTTLRVATHVTGLYAAQEGINASLLDLRDLPADTLSPMAYANKPAALQPLIDQVLASDGLVIVTPEYNGSYPGALKLFIDMLPFPDAFDGRPVCYIGLASGYWGGIRPVEQLQQVFGYRNAVQFCERVFFPGVHNTIGDDGAPQPGLAADLLASQVTGFVEFIGKMKA
ncbi:MAG: chromate reductase [Myxococcota bacterium]|jgi:NAD(P)H-dependent FMN reductase